MDLYKLCRVSLEDVHILGICGREGAGKTTICNILTGGNDYEMVECKDKTRLDYIREVIFGMSSSLNSSNKRDVIWNLSIEEQEEVLKKLICEYVDSQWFEKYNHIPFRIPVDKINEKVNLENNRNRRIEFSFATALKKVCSVIFNADYKILLAQTEEDRVKRENTYYGLDFDNLKHKKNNAEGNQEQRTGINGRVLLEYFGTEAMRNNFDKDIWIKIVKRDAHDTVNQGKKIIFPDVRFENEILNINEMGGTLLMVYKKEEDLILTEADQKTHPAKWHFLKYSHLAHRLLKFHNNVPLDELPKIFS